MAAQRIWFSSDQHFRHRMVAGKRGFLTPGGTPDIDAHDEAVVANWNARVAPHDMAWILGDITLGAAKYAWPYVDRLNWTKHLISGNHDAVHPMHRDARKHQDSWREHYASVQPFARVRMEGEEILLSHFPYQGDHTAEDRDVQYRLPDLGKTIVHGHTHLDSQLSLTGRGTLQIHVGLDAHELAPVEVTWVQERIREHQAEEDWDA
jgi:calcineurin-like phosphoesterase family protein